MRCSGVYLQRWWSILPSRWSPGTLLAGVGLCTSNAGMKSQTVAQRSHVLVQFVSESKEFYIPMRFLFGPRFEPHALLFPLPSARSPPLRPSSSSSSSDFGGRRVRLGAPVHPHHCREKSQKKRVRDQRTRQVMFKRSGSPPYLATTD